MKLLSFALFLLSQVTPCIANFGNIAGELVAVSDFLQDIGRVKEALEAVSHTGGRRTENKSRGLKSTKSSKKKGKKAKSSCDADLSVAEDRIEDIEAQLAELNQPRMLGIQTAPTCRIERGTRAGSYKLISDTLSDDTYIFSDRPYTIEYTMETEEFIADFDEIFADGPPNTGLTFSTSSGEDVGPFVVIFDSVSIDGGSVTYDIGQSENQEAVMSIESIFDGSDSVSLEHCSYFIDDWFTTYITCPICTTIIPPLIGVGETYCAEACATAATVALAVAPPFAAAVDSACPSICTALASSASSVSPRTICERVSLC